MSERKIRESTISFDFDERIYEEAGEFPVYYRTLNLTPRSEHPFWTYDAILKQGSLVSKTLKVVAAAAREIASEFRARGMKRVLFSGVGASFHLAASAAQVFGNVVGVPAEFVESSEVSFSDLTYEYLRTMVVGLSASGNTVEVVEHIRVARQAGAFTVTFVNLDNTRLVEEAEFSFVAPGGYGFIWDYTTRLAALIYLAIELAKDLGLPLERLSSLQADLREIPRQMDQVIQAIDDRCQQIGRNILARRAAVIPAAGNLLPLAWEMAIRFEEMAHFPARGRSVVDFLHGGVGYLAEDIVTVLFAAPDKAHPFLQRAAQVTQTLKSPSVAIVEAADTKIANLVDEVIRLPETHPVLRPFLYILPAQLIPYYVEVSRPGGNPDVQRTNKPRYARAFDIAYPPKSH